MKDLEELKAELAADRARLEAQDWALTVLEDFMRKLVSHGFDPRLTIPGGMVTVSFDLDAVRPEAGAPQSEQGSRAKPPAKNEDAMDEGASGAAGVGQPGADQAREARGASSAAEGGESKPPAAGESPAPELNIGPWSEDEIATATEILRKGGVNSDVARALGRGPSHVGWRCNKIRGQLRAEARAKRDPAVQGSAPPEPAPAAKRSPVPAGSSPVTAPPVSERQVQAHLDALGYDAPWSPQKDRELVEGLVRGDGLGMTAGRIGIDRDQCQARWKRLCPEVTIERQNLLLAELKRRAGARAAA